MNIWDEIYAKGEWGEGSGSGSTVETTKKYVEVVNEILTKTSDSLITNGVFDLGCGFWNGWQNEIKGYSFYIGVDASAMAIATNKFNVKAPNTLWIQDDLIGFLESEENSWVKTILIKDVLQHNSNETVWKILAKLKFEKTVIITNDSVLDGINRDCEDGGYRPIDLRLPPFNLKPTRVVDYPSSPHQKTILIFEK